MKTWKELAQRALDIQNACNLSGIVLAFADDIKDVRALLNRDGKGDTTNINKHPVAILYSTQIAYLTGTSGIGCENIKLYNEAFEWATQTAK